MTRKTQTLKKVKSQFRKTIKHYSQTNKKGGRKNSKKVVEIPFVPNPFSYKNALQRTNPLYNGNNNNNGNNNSRLPSGVSRNNILSNILYGNINPSRFVYNNSNRFSDESNSEYFSLGSNQYNPYTQMNPLYTNLSKNLTVGESKLIKSIINGNLLKNTANA